MIKLTNKEILEMKREVKRVAGINIKDIVDIYSFDKDTIEYGYYETNYDRITNHITRKEIKRG